MLELQTQSNTWRSQMHSRTADDESLVIPVALTVAPPSSFYEVGKRLFDIVGALAALVILSPLFLLIAIAIKLDTPGPVIYVQKRVGKGGRVFPFYKFRSMTNGDHTAAHRQYAKQYINGQGAKLGNGLNKAATTSRAITHVGSLLRKTSIDELPQIVCILKGDMSFIGPRPIMAYEAEEFKDWHWQRLAVLPGLTGLAQINGRSRLDFDDIVRFDITYIATRSLRQDLAILFRTIPQVLAGKDAG